MNIDEPNENDGNFRAALRLRLRAGDTVLREHLTTSGANAKYLSPNIQNQIINICGSLIGKKIVCEVHESVPFTILADESADVSAHEQLSISARYINIRNDNIPIIYEKFLGFVTVTDLTGEGIANSIESFCISSGLDLKRMVGLGLDGASSMSGKYKGVQARIREKYPMVHYTHCASHSLNLAIAKANTVVVRNTFSSLASIISFFHGYPLREERLRQAIQILCPESRRQRLKTLAVTRWVERHDAILVFLELLEPIVGALEELNQVAGGETASKANQLIHVCTSFDFIYSCTVLERPSALLLNVSKQLQSPNLDLFAVCSMIDNLVTIFERDMQDNEFITQIFTTAKSKAEMFGSSVTLPRGLARANSTFLNREEIFYREHVFLPYFQWLIEQLNLRFLKHREKTFTLQNLLPINGAKMPMDQLKSVLKPLESLLPYRTAEIEAEMDIWQCIWANKLAKGDTVPKTAVEALSECNRNLMPALFRILQIFATLPITTATSERSFSTLKRIKTYLRNTMGEERLTGLALIAIHERSIHLQTDEIITKLAEKNRKIDIIL